MEIDCDICKIRSWNLQDAESIVRHANNLKIWLKLRDSFPHPYTNTDAETYLKQVVSTQPEINFAIDVAGEAVGGIGFVLGTDVGCHGAEVGFWLGESFWGRGIATAALKGCTRYAIGKYELYRVFALPFSKNVASVRVLEKAGFLREGLMRRSAVKDGRILDQFLYAFISE